MSSFEAGSDESAGKHSSSVSAEVSDAFPGCISKGTSSDSTEEMSTPAVEAVYRSPRDDCARLALASQVHAAVMAQKEEQSRVGLPAGLPYGSICSKRLQDRMEREFPAEYDYVVNQLYNRAWGEFLEESAGLVCFTYHCSDNDWLIAPGSLRCRGRDEDPMAVRIADGFLSAVVECHCRTDLEPVCARALVGVFCSSACAGCSAERPQAQSALGALDLWEPVLSTLWRRRAEGLTVRLRDLDRPCQQLSVYVRLMCRWTELLGNVLLGKYVMMAVLRVLLNESEVPWQAAAGEVRAGSPRGFLGVEKGPDGEFVVAVPGTTIRGRIPRPPPQRMIRRLCETCIRTK